MAVAVADDPATVFCVEPFDSVARDGGAHLGTLLARVMGEPDHALLVATGTAFVIAFRDQVGRSESKDLQDNGAAEGPT